MNCFTRLELVATAANEKKPFRILRAIRAERELVAELLKLKETEPEPAVNA